jgi:hypothetical protein
MFPINNRTTIVPQGFLEKCCIFLKLFEIQDVSPLIDRITFDIFVQSNTGDVSRDARNVPLEVR